MKRKTPQSPRSPRTAPTTRVAARRVSPVAPAVRSRTRPEVVKQGGFSSLSRVAAGFLVAFFFLVPAADAFAATSEIIDAGGVFVSVATPPPDTSTPDAVEEVPNLVPEDSAALVTTDVQDTQGADNSPDATQGGAVEVMATTTPLTTTTLPQGGALEGAADAVGGAEVDDIATHTPEEDDTASTTADTEDTSVSGTSTPAEVSEVSDGEDSAPSDVVIAEVATADLVATSTGEVMATHTAELVVPGTHTTDAEAFSFSKTECVPLGNGAFQCVRRDEGGGTVTGGDGEVYAKRDADGDLEVYLNTGVTPQQITQNDIDDDAPSQDRETGDVVWHAQIDDRSQIMQYNHQTGATTKLTKEAYNSMQPASFGGDVVFQSWIGNDWEIVLIDKNDGREILTDNDVHDIAPSITQEYVMWQSFEGDAWVAKVYDRKSKEVQTVRGVEGGVVANPRMIMVFDNKKDNGDVETVGYDPLSGKVVPLAVTPVRLPDQIPEPEENQEEKAMVHTSATTRIETKSASSTGTGDDGEPEQDSVTTSTSTDEVVREATSASEVVVTTMATVTPPSTTDIPDLVIPPFNTAVHEVASTTSE